MDDSSTTASFSDMDGDAGLDALLHQRQILTDGLHANPYDAIFYLERAVVHSDLGYPDLAAGDAYRALLLTDEVRDECGEYHDEALAALKRNPASPLPKVLQHGSLSMDSVAEPTATTSEAAAATGLSNGVRHQSDGQMSEDGDCDASDYNNNGEDEEEAIYQHLATVASVRCFQILSLSLLLCGCLRSAASFAQRGLALAPSNPELLQTRDYIRTMARRRLGRAVPTSASALGQNTQAHTSEDSTSSSDSSLTITGNSNGSGSCSSASRLAAAAGASPRSICPSVEPHHPASSGPGADTPTTNNNGDEDEIPLSEYPDAGLVRREVYPWNTHEPDRFAREMLALLNRELATVAPKCEVRVSELPILWSGPGEGRGVAGTTAATPVADHESLSSRGSHIRRQLGLFAREDLAHGETVLAEYTALTACGRLDGDFCDACGGELPDLGAASISTAATDRHQQQGDDEQGPRLVACPSCVDAVFCSAHCAAQAQALYHPAVCAGQSPQETSDARAVLDAVARAVPAAEAADALHLLLLARVLAMSLHQDVHPLDVREVRHIWGDFLSSASNAIDLDPAARDPPPDWTLPFSWKYNVETPLHVLGVGYGVDVFRELDRSDLWVVNTLYAKFRGTASARKGKRTREEEVEEEGGSAVAMGAGNARRTSGRRRRMRIGQAAVDDGRPDVAAVHPLWCLANHDCDPNVRWEWAGRMRLWARQRGGGNDDGTTNGNGNAAAAVAIPAGHEILSHYCDVSLPVRERREWMLGSLGGWCVCARCREEERREAEAEGRHEPGTAARNVGAGGEWSNGTAEGHH